MSISLEDIVSCIECGKVPVDAVESDCCGGIYCWTCLLDVKNCEDCGKELKPDQCHSANAVKKMINRFGSYTAKTDSSLIDVPGHPKIQQQDVTVNLYDQLRSSANQLFHCVEGCGVSLKSVKWKIIYLFVIMYS